MKKILISTNFSDTADNASKYALELALASNAHCTFVHAYEMPYDFASQIENRIVAIKRKATERLAKMVHEIKNDPRYQSLQIEYRVEEGAAESVVTDLAEHSGIDLIVMGLSRHSGWETLISDNTGVEVIERSRIPVLAIPEKAAFASPKEIIYASEFRDEDLQNLVDLSELAKVYSARLRIIHIQKKGGKDQKIKFRGFSELVVDRLTYPYISQDLIEADDVEDGILKAASDRPDVILAVAHFRKTFLKQLFNRSLTKSLALETKTPLLIFFETEK